MKVDTWGYEIISSKHLVGKCVLNGRDNIVKRFRRVTRNRQTEGKRERETDRQTDRQTQREKGVREGETQAHTHTHFNALSLTETESLVVKLSTFLFSFLWIFI